MFSLALLSGGISGRMGQDKALMPFLGRPLILRILERLASLADEIILSTNRPADYGFLGLPLHPDLIPDCGALGGLYTSLTAVHGPIVAAVACDMPFANPTLFEYEYEIISKTNADVVIPSTSQGLEPLHALYRREPCLPVIKTALDAGKLKLVGWLPQVKTRIVEPEELARLDPHGLAFWNLNTPEEFRQAEERARLDED
jgi:molybdopterin-guanine dinucleotide biosynthesis protein A